MEKHWTSKQKKDIYNLNILERILSQSHLPGEDAEHFLQTDKQTTEHTIRQLDEKTNTTPLLICWNPFVFDSTAERITATLQVQNKHTDRRTDRQTDRRTDRLTLSCSVDALSYWMVEHTLCLPAKSSGSFRYTDWYVLVRPSTNGKHNSLEIGSTIHYK